MDRWMDAVESADLVVVVDTGSTHHSVEKLRARGAVVYEETITPWRFDEARNRALAHIPAEIDLCVSNDLDEVFCPGWREMLESTWQPTYTRASYWFTWSYHPDGTPDKQFIMEKIHRRHALNKEHLMKKYNICVYAICKNEAQFVDRWVKSMGEADQIVVTDTGSTDGTVERLREKGVVVHTAEIKPWRFDAARNLSLSNVPEDERLKDNIARIENKIREAKEHTG